MSGWGMKKLTLAEVKVIFANRGEILTDEQALGVLTLLRRLAEIVVQQHLERKDEGDACITGAGATSSDDNYS
jgi:hypothetical protein